MTINQVRQIVSEQLDKITSKNKLDDEVYTKLFPKIMDFITKTEYSDINNIELSKAKNHMKTIFLDLMYKPDNNEWTIPFKY